jgi:hypothetical protein
MGSYESANYERNAIMTDSQIQVISTEEIAPLTKALNKLDELQERVNSIPDDEQYHAAVGAIEAVRNDLALHGEQASRVFNDLMEQRQTIFVKLESLKAEMKNWQGTEDESVQGLVDEVVETVSDELTADAVSRGQEIAQAEAEQKLIDNLQYHCNVRYPEVYSLVQALVYHWERGLTQAQYELALEWIQAMVR